MRRVERDRTLPHQVILQLAGHSTVVEVSCNCRVKRTGSKYWYEGIAPAKNFQETVRIYNNPANHVEVIGLPNTKWAGLRVEFGEEWMLDGISG